MAIGVNQYQILTSDQANPFGYGLQQGAQTAAQLAKNPYIAPQAGANVQSTLLKNIYQQLVNKYTPQDYETQFGLRNAQSGLANSSADLNRLKLHYPGLGEAGIVGQLAYANLIADHPEIGKRVQAAMGGNEQNASAMNNPAAGQQPPASLNDGLMQLVNQQIPNNMTAANDQSQMSPWAQAAQMQMPGPAAAQQAKPSLAQNIAGTMPSQQNAYNPLQILMRDINADIGSKQALANWRQMGGGRGGTKIQGQMYLQNQVMRDNPGMSSDDAFEAAGNIMDGDNSLHGKPINVSGLTRTTADNLSLGRTTAAAATQGIKANQAEAELGVLNDYAQKGLEPYGDSFAGMNGPQIADTFKTDAKSQERLGRFVASQALQYEIAQNRIRLANGQPGVTSSQEMINLSQQSINAKFPKLTYAARKEAARYMDEALRKGLEARNRYGIGASGAAGRGSQPQSASQTSSDNDPLGIL